MGKYEVLCRLSTGGMAEIFLASQRGLAGFHKPVVLKKILPDIQGQEEFVQMFLDEAKVTAAFHHPHIAQVFDLDVDEGELFLTLEFVPGATLVEVARACRASGGQPLIPVGFTLAAVRDTALALHYAHTFTDPLGQPSPVIHRDVAEKNIMVTYEGVTKLLDFGIAKSLAGASRTQAGTVKGTSGYMSPEQILGQPLDARSDLFSLGVVLHECLTGMRLFHGKSTTAVMQAVLRNPIPEPSRINKAVPATLDAIVLKALARRREERYATALEFARELERAVGPLIWLPERSGELMKQLFAERREQTRQLLASGRAAVDATGEVKLAQLFPDRDAPATPPPASVTPPPPPPEDDEEVTVIRPTPARGGGPSRPRPLAAEVTTAISRPRPSREVPTAPDAAASRRSPSRPDSRPPPAPLEVVTQPGHEREAPPRPPALLDETTQPLYERKGPLRPPAPEEDDAPELLTVPAIPPPVPSRPRRSWRVPLLVLLVLVLGSGGAAVALGLDGGLLASTLEKLAGR